MSTRSAKRAAQSKLKEMVADDDVSEDLEEEDVSMDDVSEEESDYGSKKRRTAKVPSPKRAKTSGQTTQKSPTKKAGRGKKSLSLLPTVPLDVLYEIFGNMSPKDILNLAKTNKLFRQTLLAPNATTVWRAARERCGAPDPPEDMSEIAWAALLFGNTCQKCGAKNIQKVDFLLRLRVCTSCKKQHLVVESRFKTLYPDVERYILDLIPHTHTGGWSNGMSSDSRFFWDQDIENIIRKLAIYEDDVHRRRPNASKNLEEFKAQQMERASVIEISARQYQGWFASAAFERQESSADLKKQRYNAIVERFIQLGFIERDVSFHRNSPEFQPSTLLTDRIWKRIRPILEPKVAASKARRLEFEYREIKDARGRIVTDLYLAYQASLRPSEWKYLPHPFDVCKLGPFAAFIDAPAETIVTAADFTEAMEALPGLLASASEEKKDRARALVPSNPPELGEVEGPDALELATAVFTSASAFHSPSLVVIGSDDLLSHHCRATGYGSLSHYLTKIGVSSGVNFSQEGSRVATALVRLAGLDPNYTLASDMDEKDLRFTCSHCRPYNSSGSWFRLGYSWRTAITHALSYTLPVTDFGNCWSVLSPEDTSAVKTSERSDSKWEKQIWTCGRCSTYMTDRQTRLGVLDHLESHHQITDPKEPEDFFFDRFKMPFEGKIAYPVPPVDKPVQDVARVTVQCLHCSSGSASAKKRIFDVLGVVQHIKAKHNCVDPQLDRDFVKTAGPSSQ